MNSGRDHGGGMIVINFFIPPLSFELRLAGCARADDTTIHVAAENNTSNASSNNICNNRNFFDLPRKVANRKNPCKKRPVFRGSHTPGAGGPTSRAPARKFSKLCMSQEGAPGGVTCPRGIAGQGRAPHKGLGAHPQRGTEGLGAHPQRSTEGLGAHPQRTRI